jgi:hypothetical protein
MTEYYPSADEPAVDTEHSKILAFPSKPPALD